MKENYSHQKFKTYQCMYIHLLGSQEYKHKQGVPGFLGKSH